MTMQFNSFSAKQKLALRWWILPEYSNFDAIICDGAVRSGKTLSMSLGFVCWAMMRFQNASFAVCGKTITSAERNIVRPLVMILKESGFAVKEFLSKHYLDITVFGRTNRFYLFGGKDESSASMIQGMTLSGVLFDEVVLMPRSFVEQALARCSVKHAKLWFNCNPENPYHWFYREWILKQEQKNTLYLHFTMDDNPSLSEEVKERYRRTYGGVFYDRFILGKWTVSEGVVYPMFDRESHVVQKLPEHFSRYFVSCDYGTVNPTSMGLWGENNGIWYRIKEYYYDSRREGMQKTDEEHYTALEILVSGIPVECVIVDPSAASFITCIQRHQKFKVLKAQNDVVSGIRHVSDVLQQGKLRFHCSCEDILREFTQYCWNTNSIGDAPIKEHDHAMDDMRYFVSTVLFGRKDRFVAMSISRA